MSLTQIFTDIANAIRNKKGTSNKIKPSDFASEIESISGGSSGAKIVTQDSWQGTTVPNSGYVENVYFNTNLSANEVVEIIESSGLEFYEESVYYIVANDKALVIVNEGPLYVICDSDFNEVFFVSELPPEVENPFGFTGWNLDFSGSILINSEVIADNSYAPVGVQNELIKSIISTTPFIQKTEQVTLEGEYDGSSIEITENGSLDVKTLIENKQIPLSVNVNVESGSGGGIISVSELPSNPQENVLYQVDEVSDIGVCIYLGEGYLRGTLESVLEYIGIPSSITYYLVDELPSSPNISDLVNLNLYHIYIYNDIPYVYGDVGYGNMWLELVELFKASGYDIENKGYISSQYLVGESGMYVTYKLCSLGVKSTKYSLLKNEDNEWIDYEKIFDKTITTFSNSTLERIPSYAFYSCDKLENVYALNVKNIGYGAFENCWGLKSASFPSVTTIENRAFISVEKLESIYIPNIAKIDNGVFQQCNSLKCVIIVQTVSVCTLNYYNFPTSCYHFHGEVNEEFNPNGDKDGFFYVPDSMVEQYKVATNWVEIASQIKPLSELPQKYKDLYGI